MERLKFMKAKMLLIVGNRRVTLILDSWVPGVSSSQKDNEVEDSVISSIVVVCQINETIIWKRIEV